jgi:hypothetical protein
MPLVGDWNGNGRCTTGFYVPEEASFRLDNDNNFEGNTADITIEFGPRETRYIPLIGDWDGDGIDTVGLYLPANGVFFLANANEVGQTADLIFHFGPTNSTLKPVVGDWDGNGLDEVGLYDVENGVFYLKRSFVTVHDELVVAFGSIGGFSPVAGDWDGDQMETIGLYNPATGEFYLSNSSSPGGVDLMVKLEAPKLDCVPVSGEFGGSEQ